MKALITGGAGFVGSHIIEALTVEGHSVRALARPTSDHTFLGSLGAEVVIGDIEDPATLKGVCDGCDVVYHAAARVDMVGSESEFHRTTVDGTRAIMLAAAKSGVRRFVHVSSCGAYHPKFYKAGDVIDEGTPMIEPPRWFLYGRAKYFAERVVMEECPQEMDWVIVRLGYVYGPRNRTMRQYVEPALRDRLMRIVGSGRNPMAFVYVEDVARAVMLAGLAPAASRRALIAGGTEHITQQQYFDALAAGFGMPAIRRRTPYRVAYLFSWLGEYLFRKGHRATSIRRASVALTGLPQRIDCSQSRRLLDWEPRVEFEEGMARTFAWYHQP